MADSPDVGSRGSPGKRPHPAPSDQDNRLRSDRRLAERAHELDLLQSLGRRAAEAHSLDELFDSVVDLLHQAHELDLALVGHESHGGRCMALYLSRPFDDDYVSAVLERGRRFLGWDDANAGGLRRVELDGHDTARGARREFEEQDLILLPLMRRGQAVACLVVVPAASAGERGMRLLYSATNQLSLHVDRILTGREAEADRFRSIVEAMPQGVIVTDGGLAVLQANRSALDLLEAAGLGGARTLHGALERWGVEPLVRSVREAAVPFAEGEVRLDGERVCSVTVSPLPAVRGRADDLVFVLSDVTESRRMQQQLAQSEKMSSLGQLLSGVAHELNNPLASIVGYAQLVRDSGTDERTARHLQVLGRESERCKKIVQNLLSFARRREPETGPVLLDEVVDNVFSLLEYQLRVDDIRLERDLCRELPVMEGDAHQIEQLLVNLATNAAQAIRRTERPGRVVIRTRLGQRYPIVLEVEDDGPGIPRELRGKIFDPFFTTKQPGEGTGLGLSLVYGIVTGHGGTIDVVGGPGDGTTFRLEFPAAGSVAAAVEPAAPEPVAGDGPVGRILVVDDDATVAQLICDALETDGHAIVQAGDGRRALEQLADSQFDLVVSDVKMPDMGGEQLHGELRRAGSPMAGRMLLTTGDALGSEELSERTGLDVLCKPFDIVELRRRVRQRLAR